jgi:hypothetical protein
MAFEPWCNVDMLYTTDKTDADWDKKNFLQHGLASQHGWKKNI